MQTIKKNLLDLHDGKRIIFDSLKGVGSYKKNLFYQAVVIISYYIKPFKVVRTWSERVFFVQDTAITKELSDFKFVSPVQNFFRKRTLLTFLLKVTKKWNFFSLWKFLFT